MTDRETIINALDEGQYTLQTDVDGVSLETDECNGYLENECGEEAEYDFYPLSFYVDEEGCRNMPARIDFTVEAEGVTFSKSIYAGAEEGEPWESEDIDIDDELNDLLDRVCVDPVYSDEMTPTDYFMLAYPTLKNILAALQEFDGYDFFEGNGESESDEMPGVCVYVREATDEPVPDGFKEIPIEIAAELLRKGCLTCSNI